MAGAVVAAAIGNQLEFAVYDDQLSCTGDWCSCEEAGMMENAGLLEE